MITVQRAQVGRRIQAQIHIHGKIITSYPLSLLGINPNQRLIVARRRRVEDLVLPARDNGPHHLAAVRVGEADAVGDGAALAGLVLGPALDPARRR